MKFMWSTAFVSLVTTIHTVNAIPAPASFPAAALGGDQFLNMKRGGQFLNVSRSQAHKNAMANHPAAWIVDSQDLDEYFAQNPSTLSTLVIERKRKMVPSLTAIDANHTIYLSDQRAYVEMTSVTTSAPVKGKRESGGCISPAKYTKTYTKQTGSWWGDWKPASSCFWTGNSDAGGSEGLSSSTSIAITESTGLTWNIIKDVLSLDLGISVTETWSETKTYNCAVLKNSVVQVWVQNYLAWGWFWSQDCYSNSQCGDCGAEYVRGGATAPAVSPQSGQHVGYGCSTGTDKVSC